MTTWNEEGGSFHSEPREESHELTSLLVVIGTAFNLGEQSVESMHTGWGWTALILNVAAFAGR